MPLLDKEPMHAAQAAILLTWRPERIEKVFRESERGSKATEDAEKAGICPVFVPDDDVDHRS